VEAAVLIAQISDMHLRACGRLLHGEVDTAQALAAAIDHLLGLVPAPDLVLATGDLTDFARPEDYRALRLALDRLPMPVYVIPGNHDEREALRAAFADQGYLPATGEFLHYAIDGWPLRLVGLDTVIPGEVGGGLCAARLAWLDARLGEQPERPTLIFMHHPPVPTGIGFMDTPPFAGRAALKALLARHRQVRQIIAGHVHRTIHIPWDGVAVAVAPSTAYQMALAIQPGDGFFLTDQPAAMLLWLWPEADDGGDAVGPVGYTSLVGRRENAGSRGSGDDQTSQEKAAPN
jgi:3',5'-cyclic AMP phosphodiesterase CpdA